MHRQPFYPVCFALFPVLALFVINAMETPIREILAPALGVGMLALVLWAIAGLVFRERYRAALATSLVLVLFFAYGHIISLLNGTEIAGIRLFRHRMMLPAMAAIILLGLWAIHRMRSAPRWTFPLNIAGIFLVVFNLTQIVMVELGREEPPCLVFEEPALQAPDPAPDIFYFILDAYGREDLLKSMHRLDISDFIDALVQRGFQIPGQSRSNYTNTMFSLSSILNMVYLDEVEKQLGSDASDNRTLSGLIANNRVARLLRGEGYEFVAFSSGVPAAEMKAADMYVKGPWALSEFGRLVLDSTPLLPVGSALGIGPNPYSNRRKRILSHLKRVPDFAADGKPSFVVLHLLSPHPPFIFHADGSANNPEGSNPSADGSDYYRYRSLESYRRGYAAQVIHINSQVLKAIDAILENATTDPVIIIQGDHGPRSRMDWSSLEKTDIREAISAFHAYRLPGNGSPQPCESITSVNTFRLLLDRYFQAGLPLLEDRCYYSVREAWFDFTDVTEQTEGVLPDTP